MGVSDNGDRSGANHRKPVDHLRAFVASVMEPRRKNGDDLPGRTASKPKSNRFGAATLHKATVRTRR